MLAANLSVARNALRAGRLPQAESAYRRCLLEGLPVELEYAGLLLELGRHEQAESLLERALVRSPEEPDLFFARALVRSERGRLREALEDYDVVLARLPDRIPALFNRATLSFRLDRLDAALADFLRVATLDPNASDALGNAGVILLRQERMAEAVDLLRKANALAPEQPQLMRSLANALRGHGQSDQALALHERAEARMPDDPATLTDHALCLLSSGRPEEAGKRYAKALRISPGDQTALAGCYMVAVATGQTLQAAELMGYRKLLESDSCKLEDQLDLRALREAVLTHSELIWEPAGRSTRKGQQSTMLDLSTGSPFASFGRMLLRYVNQRMADLSYDASLQGHPWLLSRPTRWRLQSWATVLYHEGRQSPHIHPGGWMSGVFYLDVGDDDRNGGALIFGHLPDDVNIDAIPYEYRIQPKNGQLLSFPSYFLHHTTPYRGSGKPRISMAFDVIPTP